MKKLLIIILLFFIAGAIYGKPPVDTYNKYLGLSKNEVMSQINSIELYKSNSRDNRIALRARGNYGYVIYLGFDEDSLCYSISWREVLSQTEIAEMNENIESEQEELKSKGWILSEEIIDAWTDQKTQIFTKNENEEIKFIFKKNGYSMKLVANE